MTALFETNEAVRKFNEKDFSGMTPLEIGNWWRKEICPAITAVNADNKRIWDNAPKIHGRYTLSQFSNNEKLRDKLSTLRIRLDCEVEKATA